MYAGRLTFDSVYGDLVNSKMEKGLNGCNVLRFSSLVESEKKSELTFQDIKNKHIQNCDIFFCV